MRHIPLFVLAAAGAYMSARGLERLFFVAAPWPYAVAGALHASYMLRCFRPAPGILTAVSWTACVYLTGIGVGTLGSKSPLLPAVTLEIICLWLASPHPGWASFAERLASARRTQTEVLTQLRMAEGVWPWATRCARQVLSGTPDNSERYEHSRMAASLADSERRLNARIANAALPEQLRQSVRTWGARIVAEVETAAAARAAAIDSMVLEAIAACGDECARLPDLEPAERNALVQECERALVELGQ